MRQSYALEGPLIPPLPLPQKDVDGKPPQSSCERQVGAGTNFWGTRFVLTEQSTEDHASMPLMTRWGPDLSALLPIRHALAPIATSSGVIIAFSLFVSE